MAEEGLTKTDNDLIHIGKPIPFDTDEFLQQLENLAVVAYGNDPDIRSYVEEIVPTYHAANLGRFLGWYYGELKRRNGDDTPARIIIGKDTRRSSYMFEYTLVGGLVAYQSEDYGSYDG